jgi:hypothetical protein
LFGEEIQFDDLKIICVIKNWQELGRFLTKGHGEKNTEATEINNLDQLFIIRF